MDKIFNRNTWIALGTVLGLAVLTFFVAYAMRGRNFDPEAARAAMKKTGGPACLEKARTVAKGTNVTDSQVVAYCDCAVDKAVNSYTDEELKARLKQRGGLTEDDKQKFTAAAAACRKQVIGIE